MKEDLLQEEIQKLDEFIQKINSIVTPFSFRDELKAVMNKETRKNLSEKYPKCWFPIRMGNKDSMIFPVCNRNGATDRNMIAFSKKLANRLAGREDVDRGMLEIVMKKLDRLDSTYSKEIPKPIGPATQKGKVTKALNLLKKNLLNIRNGL